MARHSPFRMVVVLSAALSPVACGDPAQSTDYWLEVTPAGHEWAHNIGANSEPRRWRAETDLTIGVADGQGPDVFGAIESIAVSAGGEIAVLDAMAQEVRVFDAFGSHLRTSGRRGDGPGEFGYASGVLWQGDSLWVFDPRKQISSLFASDGQFVRQVASPNPTAPLPIPTVVGPDGQLMAWRFENRGRDYSIPMHMGPFDSYQPVELDPASGDVDTLPSVQIEVARVNSVRVPLSGLATMAPSSDGTIWFSHETEYILYRRARFGDTLLIVSHDDARPVPVTPVERDSLAQGLEQTARRFGRGGDVPSAAQLPSHRRFVEGVFPTASGRLYVLVRVEEFGHASVLDVYDPETGRYEGRVELPVSLQRGTPIQIVGDAIYAAVRGELDVPMLVRMRLEPVE